MGKLKTQEEFEKDMQTKHPQVQVIGKYVNAKEKVKFKCLVHNCEFETKPDVMLHRATGCPECLKEHLGLNPEEFKRRLYEVNPMIELITPFKSYREKITCKCLIDGYVWDTQPAKVLNNRHICPKCAGITKSNMTELQEKLSLIDKTIILSGKYINNKTNVHCCCLICGNEWETTPHTLLQGKGCPNCSMSKGEKLIMTFLDEKGIVYEYEHWFPDCRDKYPLPFDFYLLKDNICIEYDGQQHYHPVKFGDKMTDEIALDNFNQCKRRDNIKTQYCLDKNIKLIRIPYWEYDNINQLLSDALLI